MTDTSDRHIDRFVPAAFVRFQNSPTGKHRALWKTSAVASDAVIKAINESPLNRGLSGADWVATPGNIAIERGDNIALFDAEGDQIFQVHFLFKTTGRAAITAAKKAFDTMFKDHGADLIFGMVPADMPHAILLARKAGGKFAGKRQTEFGECELYVLSREMWKGDDQ